VHSKDFHIEQEIKLHKKSRNQIAQEIKLHKKSYTMDDQIFIYPLKNNATNLFLFRVQGLGFRV